MTGQELMELATRVAQQWKDDPNIVGVGFGVKHRKGQRIVGPALRFTVRRKFATEEEIRVAGSRPIPPEIEGVSTDVNVIDAAPSAMPTGSRGTHIEEPLKGGVSTSVLGSFLSFPTSGGTLGAICLRDSGIGIQSKWMALSNAHVWGFDLGSDIVQPLLPVGEFLEAGVKLLTCGPIISYLAEGTLPSGLTTVLAAASTTAWIAAAASDAKDPHRRGQEATPPAQPDELTVAESVRFTAEPQSLPLPGTSYQANVSWEYTRQTDRSNYTFSVNETQSNEHVLVRQYIWTDQPQYAAGRVVQIMAMLETARAERPDAFHVVAHLTSTNQPQRRISRVLHPTTCDRVPFLCVDFSDREPGSEAQFPIQKQGVTFRADGTSVFQESPSGRIGLQFPDQDLEIDIPSSSRAEVLLVQFKPGILLQAYDAQGTVVDSILLSGQVTTASTSDIQGVEKRIILKSPSSDQLITRLVLSGSRRSGLLLMVCLTLIDPIYPQPSSEENRIFCYRGQYTLDPSEPPSSWQALLSAQTVNTVPISTPPEEAAATIGGLENANLATGVACAITLALDYLFDVI